MGILFAREEFLLAGGKGGGCRGAGGSYAAGHGFEVGGVAGVVHGEADFGR